MEQNEQYFVECDSGRRHRSGKTATKYCKRIDIFKQTEVKSDESQIGFGSYNSIASWNKGKFSSLDMYFNRQCATQGIVFDDLESLGKWLGKELYDELITYMLSAESSRKGGRKLRAGWSIEIEQALRVMNGIDIDAEIANAIQQEIDAEMIAKMIKIWEREGPDMIFKDLVRKHQDE
jgi:hypothetical protein